MAIELKEMLSQFLISANANDGERYIFGGTCTSSEPFTTVGGYVLYNGNSESINIQTGQNSTTAINCIGTDAFGNMTTSIGTGNLNPGANVGTDVSTNLSDLNGGSGIPKGKIVIQYSSYPDGLEVDLSDCDTLEDVKDRIEQATLDASKNLVPSTCSWLDDSTLDWKDLTDRYVKVTVNPDGNGISLQEFDSGEPLPEPTLKEMKQGLGYSGAPGYAAGDVGVGAGTVCDKADYICGDGGSVYSPIGVDNFAGNIAASSLGIKGTVNIRDPLNPDSACDGFIHGTDLNPVISNSTLLADLAGYNDAVYTITNESIPGLTIIEEVSGDSANVYGNWNLANLSAGYNTGPDGEMYARVTRRDDPDNDLFSMWRSTSCLWNKPRQAI